MKGFFLFNVPTPNLFLVPNSFFRFARVHLAWHTSLIIASSNIYEQERFLFSIIVKVFKATSVIIKSGKPMYSI